MMRPPLDLHAANMPCRSRGTRWCRGTPCRTPRTPCSSSLGSGGTRRGGAASGSRTCGRC
eukprot:6494632-Alexandrium_andersonii.AAC.1